MADFNSCDSILKYSCFALNLIKYGICLGRIIGSCSVDNKKNNNDEDVLH